MNKLQTILMTKLSLTRNHTVKELQEWAYQHGSTHSYSSISMALRDLNRQKLIEVEHYTNPTNISIIAYRLSVKGAQILHEERRFWLNLFSNQSSLAKSRRA